MLVAMAAVVVFSWPARRFRRQQLTYILSAGFLAAYLAFLPLVGDLYSTIMVAAFFAFLNDSVTPLTAKRLYGVIGFGGVLGGVVGSTFVAARVSQNSGADWLWVTVGAGVLLVLAAWLGARWRHALPRAPAEPPAPPTAAAAGHAAGAGARLTFGSPYLLSVAVIVGLYELSSTVLDFMFTSTVVHYLSGDAIGEHFALVFSITNWVAMFVQLILTSQILRRFGMTAALLVLPSAMFLGAGAFTIVPALWVRSLLNTADNGFSYSLNQSAKEALYVPTTREQKYQAKAFIDMSVQRFAKALAVVLSLAITSVFADFESLRWLSGLVAVFVAAWFFAARRAGRGFQQLARDRGEPVLETSTCGQASDADGDAVSETRAASRAGVGR